jgi:hypothetical protein
LARLALILRSLVTRALCFSRRLLDHFELALHFLHLPPQCFTERGATPIDLTKRGIAASLSDSD